MPRFAVLANGVAQRTGIRHVVMPMLRFD